MSGSSRALMEARKLIREKLIAQRGYRELLADSVAVIAVEAINRSDDLCLVIHRKTRKPT